MCSATVEVGHNHTIAGVIGRINCNSIVRPILNRCAIVKEKWPGSRSSEKLVIMARNIWQGSERDGLSARNDIRPQRYSSCSSHFNRSAGSSSTVSPEGGHCVGRIARRSNAYTRASCTGRPFICCASTGCQGLIRLSGECAIGIRIPTNRHRLTNRRSRWITEIHGIRCIQTIVAEISDVIDSDIVHP